MEILQKSWLNSKYKGVMGEMMSVGAEWLLEGTLIWCTKYFWGCTNHWGEIRNILLLAFEVPGEGFSDSEVADTQEFLSPCLADLTEENREHQWTEDGDSDAVVERSQLTSSALKKDLQMAEKLVDYFLGITHLWIDSWCLRMVWRLSWHQAVMCIRTCRRQTSWGLPLSAQSLYSFPLPCTLHSIILTSFS